MLHEQYRPREWSQVVGQASALEALDLIRSRSGSLAGRAFWISGFSGVGKTTIAKLIAAEVADSYSTEEMDGGQVSQDTLGDIERDCKMRPFGKGSCWVINESHGLRGVSIRRLLVILESLPKWVTVIFTTTEDGQGKLFDGQIDAHPLLSRCTILELASDPLPFAVRLREAAQAEGLDGQPVEAYVKLFNDCRRNMRAAYGKIEAGCMRPDPTFAEFTAEERKRFDDTAAMLAKAKLPPPTPAEWLKRVRSK